MHLPIFPAVQQFIRQALEDHGPNLCVIGICGAQGSGKSTLAAALKRHFDAISIATEILSLDDLYLSKSVRSRLGGTIHPLLATRGVPGTHDVKAGLEVIAQLRRGQSVMLPRFDKASDDRFAYEQGHRVDRPIRLLILEGWCVGAVPQTESELRESVNSLERIEDRHLTWRKYVNVMLGGEYQTLFAQCDELILLKAPSFEVVKRWRTQQEHQLREESRFRSTGMKDDEILHFIQHYQRITEHILSEMPHRADMVISLSEDRHPIQIAIKTQK